jgi:serine phosphatase RsbU (regulator of sigma subunit)
MERLRGFASLAGELIMTRTSYGDTIVRLRRRAEMGLAAEVQWSLLPPLTFVCPQLSVAGVLEPAYEVAGDTFDYSVDPGIANLAVFDGMGHGLVSAQLAVVAVAAYRHARRAGRSLADICDQIDQVLLQTSAGHAFSTAVLAQLHTISGALRWVNAGHLEPLLFRHGQLITSLHVAPRPPLGIDLRGTRASPKPIVGSAQLEPGDSVLLYTDGVTEARAPDGTFFGDQRLTDLIIRNLAAGLPAPETMRRVVRALLEHQQGNLRDDASLVLVQWPGNLGQLEP